MSNDLRCPSCGHMNRHDAESCTQCNFPLEHAAEPPPAPAEPQHAEPAKPAEPAGRPFDPGIRRVRPVRPRAPRGPQQQLQTQLWVILGGLALAVVLYSAFQGFKQSNPQAPPVEGARQEQQHIIDMARAELVKDSTNVNARIALANVLYDTGNWSEAIVHYKSALRTDPDRIETLVDLGVCYFNLSQSDTATELFQRALKINPTHPIALFNMGIVTEGQNRLEEALGYYEKSLTGNPPQGMDQAVEAAKQRINAKLGRPAPSPAP